MSYSLFIRAYEYYIDTENTTVMYIHPQLWISIIHIFLKITYGIELLKLKLKNINKITITMDI